MSWKNDVMHSECFIYSNGTFRKFKNISILKTSLHKCWLSYLLFTQFSLVFCRIYFGAMWGPGDATVWKEKRLQFRCRRHAVFFLQYGLPPRGGARVGLSGRWAENVERSPAKMCWYVVTSLLLSSSFDHSITLNGKREQFACWKRYFM